MKYILMLKNLALIVILTYSEFAAAKELTHRDSVRQYYVYINKAELAIVDGDFEASLNFYQAAEQFKWMNCEDLFNAQAVSFLSNDTAQTTRYLNDLAAVGLKKKYFEGSWWGSSIMNTELYHFISRDYDSISGLNVEHEQSIYGEKMAVFYLRDQHVRPDPSKAISQSSILNDMDNRNNMFRFIKEYGFPSFARTGFYDTMRLVDAPGTFWYVWWHGRGGSTVLDKVTLEAVLDGDFPPDEYAVVMDARSSNEALSVFYTVPNLPGLLQPDLEEVDKRRAALYMESLADYKRKLAYRMKDNRFMIVTSACFGLYRLAPEMTKAAKRKRKI